MANNENINKVVYGNETLIDLTQDSVTPQTLLEGETAHDRSGASITGSAVVNTVIEENDSFALVPTSEGNALARKIYGMSVQDGTPTPSAPVAIESASADFKCVGKNLIPYPYYDTSKTYRGVKWTDNGDGTVSATRSEAATNISGFYCAGSTYETALKLKAGTYIVSGCPAGGSNSTYRFAVRVFPANTNVISEYGSGATFTVTAEQEANSSFGFFCDVVGSYSANNLTFKPMLRLASVADATYEPYKHTDITTSQTLRSIEVTSSDPYNLVKDGKYYIADTIDWDEVDGYTLTKRVKETVFDGTEIGWGVGTSTTPGVTMFRMAGFFDYNTNTKFATKCNRFVCISSYSDLNRDHDGYISLASSNYTIYFGMLTSVASTVDQFKTWLSTNNVTVLSEQIPTKTPITSAQAKALLSMRTYDESTSIDAVNSPAPVVELEYAKNRTSGRALTGHNEGKIDKGYEHISYAEYLQLTPQQIASGKYIVDGSSEATGIFGKVLTGSLAVGSTTVVLHDSFITTTSMIDVYTDVYGVSPTDVTVATGSITLTFEAQESILNVKVRVM